MKLATLYSIGHGNRTSAEFLNLLKRFDIKYLIDVRSKPYSKFNPHFNQQDLKQLLEHHGIRYVFMGDSLGGRPEDLSCYTRDGKVDYEIVKTKDFFLKGIDRLRVAYAQGAQVVIMCSESKPLACHRTKLIGRVLQQENMQLVHIDEKGKVRSQIEVISELNKGLGETDLFGNPLHTTSVNSYL